MKKHITVFFAIALIFAVLFSSAGCESLFDSVNETTTEKPDKSVVDNETADVLNYYESLLDKILSVKPSTSVSRGIDAKDIKFYDKGAEESDSKYDILSSAAGQGKKYIFTDISSIEIEPKEVEYGGNITTVLKDTSLKNDFAEIKDAKFNEKTEKDENNEDITVIDGGKFVITLADVNYPVAEGSLLAKLFDFFNPEEIIKEFDKTKEYLQVGALDDFDILYTDCKITVELDRKKDQIGKITLEKNAQVTAPVEGKGELESYGEMDVKFRFVDTTTYTFNWSDPEKLIIGYDEDRIPMLYSEKKDEYKGFDFDVATAIGEYLNKAVEIKAIKWDKKDEALEKGDITCLWNGFAVTSENEKSYAWTSAYMDNKQVVVVLDSSSIKDMSDLTGKKGGAQKDSSAIAAVNTNANINGDLILKKTDEALLKDLDKGKLDFVICDISYAEYLMTKEDSAYRILDTAIANEFFAVAFSLENTELRDKVQAAYEALYADGTLSAISNKWFGEDIILNMSADAIQ